MISFEEYCEDFLDLHIGLLSGQALQDAQKSYAIFAHAQKNPKSVKQQKIEAFNAGKDNEVAMLAFHGIDKAGFEAATIESISQFRTSKEAIGFKDAKRQLWHDYRVDLQKKINLLFKRK